MPWRNPSYFCYGYPKHIEWRGCAWGLVMNTPSPFSSGGPPQAHDRQPVFNAPRGTVILCCALIAVYALGKLLGPSFGNWLLTVLAFLPGEFLAQFGPQGTGLAPLAVTSLVTHAFLHADAMHLLINCGFLLAFGALAERQVGTGTFLTTFVLSAAAGAIAQTLAGGPGQGPMIGASGGVYGMMGLAVRLLFIGNGGPRLRRGLQFIAVIMVLNLVIGLLSGSGFLLGGRVAWQAHIGGFLAGLAIGLCLRRRQRPG